MRSDQAKQLETLAEKVLDVFLTEANPENWTGAQTPADEMNPATRGARNWDMKNANQAGALAMRVLDLKDRVAGLAPAGPGADDAADADIAKFEKQAKKLLEAVGARRGK